MAIVVLLLEAVNIETSFELRKNHASALHSTVARKADEEVASKRNLSTQKFRVVRLLLVHEVSVENEALPFIPSVRYW